MRVGSCSMAGAGTVVPVVLVASSMPAQLPEPRERHVARSSGREGQRTLVLIVRSECAHGEGDIVHFVRAHVEGGIVHFVRAVRSRPVDAFADEVGMEAPDLMGSARGSMAAMPRLLSSSRRACAKRRRSSARTRAASGKSKARTSPSAATTGVRMVRSSSSTVTVAATSCAAVSPFLTTRTA